MFLTIALFIIGFVFLIRGAEWLIEGATVVAKKFGISDLIIGLTVVAFGTSLPELIVNLFAGSESGDLAIGNIVGSNIANILLILGIASIIHPLSVHRTTVYREIVFNVMASVMLAVLVSERLLSAGGFDGLDRIDGLILISYFIAFLYYTFGRTMFGAAKEQVELEVPESYNVFVVVAKLLGGIFGLYLGGQWIVGGATEIAALVGASDALIGLTVVAVGTSLPELAASIIAVRNKNVDIAVGNAVGSNLFNVFWVLGLSAFLRPLPFSDDLLTDVIVMLAVSLLLFAAMLWGKHKHQISKNEGYLFISLYVCYIIFAVSQGVGN